MVHKRFEPMSQLAQSFVKTLSAVMVDQGFAPA
jgi:hypothetical protein